MMLVATPPGGKRMLEEHLVNPLSAVGQLLQVTLSDVAVASERSLSAQKALVARHTTATAQLPAKFRFRVEGADRPGIVKEVTAVLAQHAVNCERLESHTKKPKAASGAAATDPLAQAIFLLTGDAEASPYTVNAKRTAPTQTSALEDGSVLLSSRPRS
jgi:glycine cleavage system regulatory protein